MRAGTMTALALAMAATGCSGLGKKLGFTDETTKDWSDRSTKSGTYLALEAPRKVKVEEFVQDFQGAAPKVKLALKNEGEVEDLLSVELEFAYPAPEGSFAEYEPVSVSIDIPNFKNGDVHKKEYAPPAGTKGTPLFAQLVTEVRMTTGRENSRKTMADGSVQTEVRRGTLLMDNTVEVVDVDAELNGDKPTLTFVLENVNEKDPSKAIGDLQYKLEMYKLGEDKKWKSLPLGPLFKGLRPVGSTLGEKGKTVTLEVKRLETALASAGSLAGAKPVLRLVKVQ